MNKQRKELINFMKEQAEQEKKKWQDKKRKSREEAAAKEKNNRKKEKKRSAAEELAKATADNQEMKLEMRMRSMSGQRWGGGSEQYRGWSSYQ